MPDIRIVGEADLRAHVPLDRAAIDCIEDAFRTLAGGGVEMPPILSMPIHDFNGEVDVKTAYVPGVESFAIKVSPGFFDNPGLGLPSTSGLMVLFSARTGLVEAVLLDNGYLTDVRTAAAGAVAARHLSRPDAHRAAILGAGMQAGLQLEALTQVRDVREAVIWGRNIEAATRLAGDLRERLGITVTASDDAESAVGSADIIVTTTPATKPILLEAWLRPGQHVTAMGSDQPNKCELEPACLARADLYVADRLSQTRLQGELRAALAVAAVEDRAYPELGQIIAQTAEGRTSDHQITIADLTGTGVQDTAIATLAYARIRKANAGTAFSS
ncbi:cyclodeaminase [Ovoidimarina sediminis]|uniref:cyclodeaminase n=1 Tax=Ovoidimarina sediminis TaxID=3079856 RepID=UPI00290770FB|nr:cyclodeaminase [Rhodophyticola sp. MJ-SS7]MDU8944650.1 cyclodeaminase [Rhodophyticola sp. MJ-SS7]